MALFGPSGERSLSRMTDTLGSEKEEHGCAPIVPLLKCPNHFNQLKTIESNTSIATEANEALSFGQRARNAASKTWLLEASSLCAAKSVAIIEGEVLRTAKRPCIARSDCTPSYAVGSKCQICLEVMRVTRHHGTFDERDARWCLWGSCKKPQVVWQTGRVL